MVKMRWYVIRRACNPFTGSDEKYYTFNTLSEAWEAYKDFRQYDFVYAGNDYCQTKKPFLFPEFIKEVQNKPYELRKDNFDNHFEVFTVQYWDGTKEKLVIRHKEREELVKAAFEQGQLVDFEHHIIIDDPDIVLNVLLNGFIKAIAL